MSTSKKIFLVIFALFIVVINIISYIWAQSLKAEEVPYLKDEVVYELIFDHQGRLWATVSHELYGGCSDDEVRVYENGVITRTFTDIENGCKFALGEFILDSTDHVWLWVQQYGKDVAINDGEKWLEVPLDFMRSEPNIRTIAIDAQGKLWIGVRGDGLYVVDGSEWENYTVENSGLQGETVTGIAFDDQDRAWIASGYYEDAGGVNIFDGKNWQAYTPENSPLLSKTVTSITFDKQNRAWIGTDKGITVFDGRDWVSYPTDTVDLYTPLQWRNGKVVTMVFDGLGRVWVNDTRVFDGQTWKYFLDPYHSGVNDTTVDSNGNIWIATNNGVAIIRPDSPQPVSYAIGMAGLAIAKGAMAYITVILLIAWISVVFNTWQSIGFGLLGLPVYFIWILMRAPNVESFGDYGVFILNPAVFGTIGGIIGGAVEIYFKRHGGTSTKQWGLIGFVIGTVFSFCILSLPGGIY